MAKEPKDLHEDPALAGLDDDLFDFDELDQPVEPQGVSFGHAPEPGVPAIARGPQAVPGSDPRPAGPVATHADGANFTPLEDAELDHDLFGFDELFLGEAPATASAPVEPAPAPAPRAEADLGREAAPRAAEPVAEESDDAEPAAHEDDWDAFDLAPTEPAAAPASAVHEELDPALLRASARPQRPVPPASVARDTLDPHAPPAPLDVEDAPRRGRLVELLVACFLLVNTSLVVLAWRAGDDFRATLHELGQGLAGATVAARDGRPDATRASVPAHLPEPVTQEPVAPVEVPDLTRTTLDLAREALDDERFEDARRGLYRLLANQDRAALAADQVAEAEVLIARSYHLQGLAVREGGAR